MVQYSLELRSEKCFLVLQVNGIDVNNINSLSEIDQVLASVEAAIGESGTDKSPLAFLETVRGCAK